MHRLWLRLAETVAGRPPVTGRPGPARPMLSPVFGTEPIAAFERQLAGRPPAGLEAAEGADHTMLAPPALASPPPPQAAPAALPDLARSVPPAPSMAEHSPLPALAPRREAGLASSSAVEADGGRDPGRGDPGRGAVTGAAPGLPRPGARPAGEHPSAAAHPPRAGQTGSARPLTPGAAGRAGQGTQPPRPLAARTVPPLPAAASRAALAASATAPAVPPGHASSSAPTIEIRIGRIEVRADRAPAQPPAAAPADGSPQVSLEDYLRSRTAGR